MEQVKRILVESAERLEKVCRERAAAGDTLMMELAGDIFTLTSFIQRGSWQFTPLPEEENNSENSGQNPG